MRCVLYNGKAQLSFITFLQQNCTQISFNKIQRFYFGPPGIYCVMSVSLHFFFFNLRALKIWFYPCRFTSRIAEIPGVLQPRQKDVLPKTLNTLVFTDNRRLSTRVLFHPTSALEGGVNRPYRLIQRIRQVGSSVTYWSYYIVKTIPYTKIFKPNNYCPKQYEADWTICGLESRFSLFFF